MKPFKKKLKKARSYTQKALKKLKNPYWRAKQRYITYYDTLPIDEKTVLIESQQGISCNGNMFYLAQYLCSAEEYADYSIYISIRGGARKTLQTRLDERGLERVKTVILSSDEYFRILSTAKYLFNDNTFLTFFVKKEGQIYVNTWHGTPLKTLGRKLESGRNDIGNVQKNFVLSDYLLVPNERTRRALVEDYMVENLMKGKLVYGGYPRNTVFFDTERQNAIRQELNPDGKRLYAYMPTFRGAAGKGGSAKSSVYMQYYLYELDKQLGDQELLYVNLHPVTKKTVDFSGFVHIRKFPTTLETYEMLSVCDCLITDYSSVFFDYAATRRKIVLFPYDLEEYLADRGIYAPMDELPFPKVFDVPALLRELRSPKAYDDADFLRTYCPYDSKDAIARLCGLVFSGHSDGLRIEAPVNNGKENVLIYSGNLDKNGVTSSLRNLLSLVDADKRNYYVTFKTDTSVNSNQEAVLSRLPENILYFTTKGIMNLTIRERFIRAFFNMGLLPAPFYVKRMEKRIRQERLRCYGDVRFDDVIHFCGYGRESVLFYSLFDEKKTIYVHSDMVSEIKTRGLQRKDVLAYVYSHYDKVAVVTRDIIDSTSSFTGSKDNIVVCRNLIDYKTVLERSTEEIALDATTRVFPRRVAFSEMMESDRKKFICVGRFSPEKAHCRLIRAFHRYIQEHPDSCLIIMGGNELGGEYGKAVQLIKELNMEQDVVLLLRVSNPFPIVKACDYSILASLYEGFGLVLAEADILGLPVVSTDCTGPCTFMAEHGGKIVENSEEGVYQGLCMLGDGRIKPMNVDYEAYNREALGEFENLF